MTSDITVKVPPRFYDDHVSRDLPAGVEVKRTGTSVTVRLTPDEFAELRSDAAYYAQIEGDPWLRGIISSAKATLNALDRATQGGTAR